MLSENGREFLRLDEQRALAAASQPVAAWQGLCELAPLLLEWLDVGFWELTEFFENVVA